MCAEVPINWILAVGPGCLLREIRLVSLGSEISSWNLWTEWDGNLLEPNLQAYALGHFTGNSSLEQ